MRKKKIENHNDGQIESNQIEKAMEREQRKSECQSHCRFDCKFENGYFMRCNWPFCDCQFALFSDNQHCAKCIRSESAISLKLIRFSAKYRSHKIYLNTLKCRDCRPTSPQPTFFVIASASRYREWFTMGTLSEEWMRASQYKSQIMITSFRWHFNQTADHFTMHAHNALSARSLSRSHSLSLSQFRPLCDGSKLSSLWVEPWLSFYSK